MTPFRFPLAIFITTVSIASLTSTAFAQSGSRSMTPRPSAGVSSARVSGAAPASNGIAVVELFTSQGCNSCPPADATLRQIASVASKNQLPVHVLSFHVDYWNRLGWTDPYSDVAYSQRQRAYASAIKGGRVYTPQMIVNGSTEFVGSHQAKAHQAITRSLARRASTSIGLDVAPASTDGTLEVRYQLSGSTRKKILNVALVHTPAANAVPRGENAGRQLAHVNVVRDFRSLSIDARSGTVRLEVPEDVDPSKTRVIAYVQDPKSLIVTGAAASN
ncbi:MAG: DUF1223 domain-containing protein [Planctomycetota bacterium]